MAAFALITVGAFALGIGIFVGINSGVFVPSSPYELRGAKRTAVAIVVGAAITTMGVGLGLVLTDDGDATPPPEPVASQPVVTAAQATTTTQSAIPTWTTDPTPSPNEIADDVESYPPLQQEAAAAAWAGLQVDWTLEFSSASRWNEDQVYVLLREPSENELVTFFVSLSEYPTLETLRKDELVRVRGTVEDVDSSVGLTDVILIFP